MGYGSRNYICWHLRRHSSMIYHEDPRKGVNVFWDSSSDMSRDTSGPLLSWNPTGWDEALSTRRKPRSGDGIPHRKPLELNFPYTCIVGTRRILVDANLPFSFYGYCHHFLTHL